MIVVAHGGWVVGSTHVREWALSLLKTQPIRTPSRALEKSFWLRYNYIGSSFSLEELLSFSLFSLAHSGTAALVPAFLLVVGSFVVRILFTKKKYHDLVCMCNFPPVYLLHTFPFSSPLALALSALLYSIFFFISSCSPVVHIFSSFLPSFFLCDIIFIGFSFLMMKRENSLFFRTPLGCVCDLCWGTERSRKISGELKSHTDESNTNYKLGQC